jgi:hypothetical protein
MRSKSEKRRKIIEKNQLATSQDDAVFVENSRS